MVLVYCMFFKYMQGLFSLKFWPKSFFYIQYDPFVPSSEDLCRQLYSLQFLCPTFKNYFLLDTTWKRIHLSNKQKQWYLYKVDNQKSNEIM